MTSNIFKMKEIGIIDYDDANKTGKSNSNNNNNNVFFDDREFLEDIFLTQQVNSLTPSSCCDATTAGTTSSGKKRRISRSSSPASTTFEKSEEYSTSLAKAMNKLSVAERERIQDDMHGVLHVQEETREFIDECMKGLDKELANLPRSVRSAYDRAIFLRPGLKTDTKFKLMFLRSKQYDTKISAMKIATYFANKLVLFGENKLVKRLSFEDDFNENEKQIIRSGCFLRLPDGDSIGRPINYIDMSKLDLSDQDAVVRAAWYSLMDFCYDENGQRKGVLLIASIPCNIQDLKEPLGRYVDHFGRMGMVVEGVPLRMSASHFCIGDGTLQFFINLLWSVRMKCHFGSPTEMRYSLLTYGISLPTTNQHDDDDDDDDGEQQQIQKVNIKKWIKIEQNEKEVLAREEAESGIVVYPQPEDALIGRGQPYHDFSGTKRLFNVIDSLLPRYSQYPERSFERTCIAMEVVKRVQDYNGRFLSRIDRVGWKILDDPNAREKVTNLFRYYMKKQKKQKLVVNNNHDKNTTTTSSSKRRRNVIEITAEKCRNNVHAAGAGLELKHQPGSF